MGEEMILKLENLSKNYGRVEAVKNLDLEVRQGEVFGFLGPNGAGKTTTIKVCTGLLRPTGGRVWIKGYELGQEPARAKSYLGYVPDNPFLYEKLTGREYVQFVARLYQVNSENRERRIEDFFSSFKMEDSIYELIQGYSRGMRQKTALIAALIHRPDLLLVDEPTANLDPRSARLVKDIFRSIKEQGRTVFMSTHVMEIAENLCDRIAIIHQGELLALGTMEELLAGVKGSSSLEDIFLSLTEGHDEDTREIIRELTEEGRE